MAIRKGVLFCPIGLQIRRDDGTKVNECIHSLLIVNF